VTVASAKRAIVSKTAIATAAKSAKVIVAPPAPPTTIVGRVTLVKAAFANQKS
jgi:hypothetical protein